MSEQKEQEPQRFQVLERWAEYQRRVAEAASRGYTSGDTQNAIAQEMTLAPQAALEELAEVAGAVEALQQSDNTHEKAIADLAELLAYRIDRVHQRINALERENAELRGLFDRWAIAVQGFANQLAVVEQRVAALTLAADAMEDNLADERALNCRDRLHALESKMTDMESRRP